MVIVGKIFSPAFFSLHKVRPLRKVRAELKGDPPALNISEIWTKKTNFSGLLFVTWWSPRTSRVHVSMMAMQRKKMRKMTTTVTAAITALPFSMSSSRYSPSLNLSLSLSVTWTVRKGIRREHLIRKIQVLQAHN